MNYITIQEAAEKWGLKDRRVQVMCQKIGVATSEQSVKTIQFITRIMIKSIITGDKNPNP